MKRIAVGDIHLSGYKDDPIQEDGLPLRLSQLINVFNNICSFAKKNGITCVDILGDVHNDKDIIYTDAQNVFINVLNRFPDLNFHIFSGNHDMSSKGEFQSTAIQPLDQVNNVECYYEPTVIDNITIVPYSNKMVEHIMNADPNAILLSHFGLNEAKVSSGISIVSDISLRLLSKFKLVLLGHYHKPQKLENKHTTLYYTGNPIHLNWGDKNDSKRFLMYDTDTLEVVSLKLSGFVEFREFVIDDNTEDPKTVIREAEELRQQGHKVRVRKTTKNKIVIESKDLVIIDDTPIEAQDRGISITMTRQEQLKKYMELKGIPEEEQEEYLTIGKSLAQIGDNK